MSEGDAGTREMSTELVPVCLPNGSTVRVEVCVTGSPEQQVSSGYDKLDLERVRHAIEGIASLIASAFQKVRPQKASAEFGIEIGMETGGLTALLVKGTGKANIKISLEWSEGRTEALGSRVEAPEDERSRGG